MNSTSIPSDFILILVVLGALIPWRGAVRVKRFLSQPELTAADRLSLYASTIVFQWVLVAVVFWRAVARTMTFAELGVTIPSPWQTAAMAVILTALVCATQFAGLRRTIRMPASERGPLFQITEKIMPRTSKEIFVFAALACTAGISEEFLYRGFVFAVFAHVFTNFVFPALAATILSSLWFAAAHLYQGRRGVITTLVVGIVFSLARIFTGSLLPSVVAHIGVDLLAGFYIARVRGKI